MDKNLDNVIKNIKSLNDSMDLNIRYLNINNNKIGYVYFESVVSDDKISDFIGKSLNNNMNLNIFQNVFYKINNHLPNSKVKIINTYEDILFHLFSGFTCIIINGYSKCIAVETKANLDRGISESTSEPILKGPKDSFNENIITNIGLIRKRIKDKNLLFKELIIGRRSKSKVVISYIEDIVEENKIKLIINKLKKIDIDGIIDSNYIKELLVKNDSILPKLTSTERPDIVSINLLNGKIAILVENSPYVILLPTIFTDFFTTSEDYFIKPTNATFTRIIRYIAFFIAILTPAFYIAVTNYNMEIIPLSLLNSFQIQRSNVPFPTIIEILILIFSYEILKEADTRKPQIMGASISIVGALILGDAAVSAGIISPIVVIIISISAVAGMSFNDIDLSNAIRIWRILFILSATIFGIVGIISLFIIFLAKLCSIEILDTPYLYPVSPFNFNDIKNNIIKKPQSKIKKRPLFNKKNITRLEIKK